ncbi:FAD-dependent oxidoreductase [Desulfatitalea alkaliphila]|uniref:FAD-dependent oxidoreductase n=1 Tax=Desulfatitalea alkaliphila TaxID=2929485 RepID=A0AA41UP73_9BACT|nr:FAD-dependent oxidoreductase [Desulfatitalea alkaliphila]MCJ8500203.1 FAD-dependent oxidoreductase [Desulfatitalea alkaliphila]
MTQETTGAVMVVGGGIAGIQASLDLAESGFKVYLVERNSAIGGKMAQLDKTFPTNDCSMCIISPKLVEAGRHLNIEMLTMATVEGIDGEPGAFTVQVREQPRFVDMEKCTACGECAKVCPIEVPNRFDEGLQARKAAYKLYPQAMPGAFAIEKKGTAPCKATCPANVGVQGWIALMNQGNYRDAIALFKEAHPFPGVCGRVCHHPCEGACTRAKVDQPLDIMHLHRYLADIDMGSETRYLPEKKAAKNQKVAVIGSGPAGLSCAYFLAIEGYAVTVFEKHDVLGGMLVLGIPEYRLPRDVIAAEIQTIRDLGVEFKTGVEIGKTVTIGQLREQGYKAFFMGIGAQECKVLGIEGEEFEGVYPGMDYLRRINLGETVSLGDRVAVIGGGNVAMDAVRTALRKGSQQPFIIYRRSEAEMPASADEIAECRDEGIEIMTLTNPVRVIADNGRVTGIECIRMELGEPDPSGRRRPEPIAGSEFIIEVDAVVPAIGQESDWACLTDECACTLTDWGTMNVDPVSLQTRDADIFAGGDAVTGPATVVEAIEAGKQAAISIQRYIEGVDLQEGRGQALEAVTDVPLQGHAIAARALMPHRAVEQRVAGFEEVQLGFDENLARAEGARCLACGVCSECYMCVKACLAGAVDHRQIARTREVKVGAVILAPGFVPYDPTLYETYSYANHPNVVTSLEFERMLSASGPFAGHLVRPSDHKEPRKIAFLQCVGSRDINHCDNGYCSSVCCMYANKQAVIAKEHSSSPLDATIFFMDMRTFGKDFDKYNLRAQNEHGVRMVRSRIHSVYPAEGEQLRIVYATEAGKTAEERYDLVVLSVGLTADPEAVALAGRLGIDLNPYGFVQTRDTAPVNTSRDGIYVCGAFQEPKDIPHSVMEASAAAACAGERLAAARWSLTQTRELPPETDIEGQPVRVGVFVCNCGINIGGVADVPAVRDYAKSLPYVVHVEDNLFSCSQDTQDHMKAVIQEKQINRVVVASCSPRTHEPLFQETIREAGLNKYLFEMANIRDQNTWVHMNNPEKATRKAKELVRMAVAKATFIEPLYHVSVPITKTALVVGGGVAGMEAALGIAEQGCEVHLVEKQGRLGGNARHLRATWQGEDLAVYLADLIERTRQHPRIHLHLDTEVTATHGAMGNMTSTLTDGGGRTLEIAHGAALLAVGAVEYKPTEYLYGKHPNVLTHLDLDAAFNRDEQRLITAKCAVFIQCVGSRTEERPYCSKICCTHSLKAALALKEKNPAMKVFILYRDIRAYGFREKLYQEARAKGVIFIRFDPEKLPSVAMADQDQLLLTVTDHVLRRPIRIKPDLLILAAGIEATKNNRLYELFKVPVNDDGFLVEAHAKLRPVDFSSEGIFLAGLAHYPKPMEESIAQAKAAAARAMTLLSKEAVLMGGVVAVVDAGLCAACLTCVRSCPYHIPHIDEHSHAVIDPALCHGCGTCVSECPGKAITLKHFTDDQLIAKAHALFEQG